MCAGVYVAMCPPSGVMPSHLDRRASIALKAPAFCSAVRSWEAWHATLCLYVHRVLV